MASVEKCTVMHGFKHNLIYILQIKKLTAGPNVPDIEGRWVGALCWHGFVAGASCLQGTPGQPIATEPSTAFAVLDANERVHILRLNPGFTLSKRVCHQVLLLDAIVDTELR